MTAGIAKGGIPANIHLHRIYGEMEVVGALDMHRIDSYSHFFILNAKGVHVDVVVLARAEQKQKHQK
jgi:hypothetical protein